VSPSQAKPLRYDSELRRNLPIEVVEALSESEPGSSISRNKSTPDRAACTLQRALIYASSGKVNRISYFAKLYEWWREVGVHCRAEAVLGSCAM